MAPGRIWKRNVESFDIPKDTELEMPSYLTLLMFQWPSGVKYARRIPASDKLSGTPARESGPRVSPPT